MDTRRRQEVLLAIGWCVLALYVGWSVYTHYQAALADGNLAIGSSSAWRDMIPFEVLVAVITLLVAVLALLGLGVFPMAIGGAILSLVTLVQGLVPCHGCHTAGAVDILSFWFRLGLGGASLAFAIREWRAVR
jgi:hypothetical protein